MSPNSAALPRPAIDPIELDKAFATLKTYDTGGNRAALLPIDYVAAAVPSYPPAARLLETRLIGVLKSSSPNAAKEYACRKLATIGSAESAPALAGLLPDEKLSVLARLALEHIPAPEAVKALRESLPKVSGLRKVGVINSLGARRDAESVAALVALLKDGDAQIAGAAAAALGNIATVEAARALQQFQPTAPESIRLVVADACLACAEQLNAAGRQPEAAALFKALATASQPKHVRAAAERGLRIVSGAHETPR
jgi:HEAT repeat protein